MPYGFDLGKAISDNLTLIVRFSVVAEYQIKPLQFASFAVTLTSEFAPLFRNRSTTLVGKSLAKSACNSNLRLQYDRALFA